MQWEFELGVILLSVLILIVLRKSNSKIYRRFGLTFLAVLLFEYFTHPLWINTNLQSWAYLYLDVSWVITLCWTNLIVVSMAIIEYLMPKAKEWKKFLSLMILVIIKGLYLEWLFLRLGIRQYPEVIQAHLDNTFRIANVVPLVEIFYLPTFLGLIIGFVKYWEITLDAGKGKIKKNSGRNSR